VRRWALLAGIGFLVVFLDQATKFWAVGALTPAFDESSGFFESVWAFWSGEHPCRGVARTDCPTLTVMEGFWYWRYVENPGAAWGFLRNADPSIRIPFFYAISVLAVVFIISFYRKLEEDKRLTMVALALVFGGAVGNFLDRLHLTYVIDFIDMFIGSYHWPTYNVADSAISVGVGLLVLEWLLEAIAARKNPREARAS
jgi:signal peptidase II